MPDQRHAADREGADPRIIVAAVAALALLAALPWLIGSYWLRIATTVAMFAVIAQGLNVMAGFAGYHAFGNVVFFGIGAYVTGIAMSVGVPFAVTLPLAAGVAALIAALIGWPVLRLKGHYFAIATVALNATMIQLINNVGGPTGGASGLPLPLPELEPESFDRLIYGLMTGLAVGSTLFVVWLRASRLGFALQALKDSEWGAEVMGVDTVRAKITAWAISAAITAPAGGIWAYWLTFIEPGSAFDIMVSVKAYVMMLIGGMGNPIGPILGAIGLELVSTLVWSQFLEIHQLVLGVLIVCSVMLLPKGITGLFQKRQSLASRPQVRP